MLYYVRLKDDKHKRRYKVRQAKSLTNVINCILFAQASGSVGGVDTRTDYYSGFPHGNPEVLADVVEVNSDNTERAPYTKAY